MTQRRAILCAALRKRLAGVVGILPQEVGLHVTISLANTVAPRLPDVEIAARAAVRGLNLDPPSSHSIATPALRVFSWATRPGKRLVWWPVWRNWRGCWRNAIG